MFSSFVITLQIAIVIILGVAVWAKVNSTRARSEFRSFVATIVRERRVVSMVSSSLVMAETLAGAALLVPVTVPFGFMLSTGLFAIFGIIIRSLIRRGRKISCHCFGSRGDAPMGWPHFVRAIVLSLASASCLVAILLGVTISFDDYMTPAPWLGGLALALALIRVEDVAYAFGWPEQAAEQRRIER